jgi:hypothetical protein
MASLPYRACRYGYFMLQTKARPLLNDGFDLDGARYPLFLHHLGMTWRTERIVEIPIARRFLAQFPPDRVLEVGAVLTQYFGDDHAVVDKYQRTPGVINEDAETFQGGPYEAIVCISTLEHIGWDEVPRDADKTRRVVEHLRDLLVPGGQLLITVPHGWNRDLDDLLACDALPFDQVSYLRRLDFFNRHWVQVDRSGLDGRAFGYPFVGASGIAVCRLTKH